MALEKRCPKEPSESGQHQRFSQTEVNSVKLVNVSRLVLGFRANHLCTQCPNSRRVIYGLANMKQSMLSSSLRVYMLGVGSLCEVLQSQKVRNNRISTRVNFVCCSTNIDQQTIFT
jgi:hypothetical protein